MERRKQVNRITNTDYEEQSVEFTTGVSTTSVKVFYYSPNNAGIGYVDNVSFVKKIITGTGDVESKMFVYPNPTNEKINLSETGDWKISVYVR